MSATVALCSRRVGRAGVETAAGGGPAPGPHCPLCARRHPRRCASVRCRAALRLPVGIGACVQTDQCRACRRMLSLSHSLLACCALAIRCNSPCCIPLSTPTVTGAHGMLARTGQAAHAVGATRDAAEPARIADTACSAFVCRPHGDACAAALVLCAAHQRGTTRGPKYPAATRTLHPCHSRCILEAQLFVTLRDVVASKWYEHGSSVLLALHA